MTQSQFSCPHCSNPFQIDTSSRPEQVACPHCSQPVSVASNTPTPAPPLSEPPRPEPPVAAPPPIAEPPQVASTTAPPVALPDVAPALRDYSPADLLPPAPNTSGAASQIDRQDANLGSEEAHAPEVHGNNEAEDTAVGDVPLTNSMVASPPMPADHSEREQLATDDRLFRQQAADDRASRRFIKNTIVWTCCAIVLLVVLAYFIKPSGS